MSSVINLNHNKNRLNQKLIANIQRIMQQKGITEAELVRQTHIPQTTLNKILTGETIDPRISTLQLLASYFDTTVDDLYKGNNDLYNHKKIVDIQSVPILSWSDCIDGTKYMDSLNHESQINWIVIEQLTKYTYGLISKPSMEPRFPRNTTLIISPETTPTDGDWIVAHYKGTEEATLRELIFNGSNKLLISFNSKTSEDILDENIKILGVLIQARLAFHK